ncbi:MAG: hypothetical protein J7L22_06200 [Candidatus Marinimicrobia bacterium]|nr:hypothetical protein [Candidatus Neomarinimicrobiota bacterium]
MNSSETSRFTSDIEHEISGPRNISSDDDMQSEYEFIVNSAKEFMSLIDRDYRFVVPDGSCCFAHNPTRPEFIGGIIDSFCGKEQSFIYSVS